LLLRVWLLQIVWHHEVLEAYGKEDDDCLGECQHQTAALHVLVVLQDQCPTQATAADVSTQALTLRPHLSAGCMH
jgi:hypothetical protein